MRLPADQARFARPHRGRARRLWVIGILVVLILGLLGLQAIANFYTNYLWYRSESLTYVWRGITETKLSLAAVFTGIMFIGLWLSLYAVDRMSTRVQLYAPELDLVRRYQTVVGHRTALVRTIVALVIAFLVGESAASQWQNWMLFNNEHLFGFTDPLFGRDAGFFVFRLPFLNFVVNWTLLALIVIFVVTAIFHYLNGGIRLQGGGPHIDPIAVAHLSLILGLAAFVKAISYYYVQRYELEYSSRGVVHGASYTDVHVELPAYTLLAVVALVAFGLLVFNVYQRSLSLPLIGIGLWLIVALSVGIIYPAMLQAFRVTPAQSTLELPYISDNIRATNIAYALNSVDEQQYAANTTLTAAQATGEFRPTLDDSDLWDPSQTATTFNKLQDIKQYFDISGLAVDRYDINGTTVPEVIGVRTVTTSGLPSSSWVNTHLAYTHGYGMVLAAANTGSSIGNPAFSISNLPPTDSGAGTPALSQPRVYFGVQSSNYVVVNSAQSEIDYTSGGSASSATGSQVTSHYGGPGGIPIGSFWTRAAFALRFHDLNLLISKLITPQSKIIILQDVTQMVEKAAPFLTVDSNPYPVLYNGQIYWMVDAYTTSSYFPYSQTVNTSALSSGSNLQGSYNYIRNSVVATVNAYTGAISFYQLPMPVGESDPVLQAWMAAFPGMFQPYSSLPTVLAQHLRYPQDMLSVQASMFGRYHVISNTGFYSGANAWNVAQSPGSGSPTQPLPTNPDGSVIRDTPTYELLQLNPAASATSSSSPAPSSSSGSSGSPSSSGSAGSSGSSGSGSSGPGSGSPGTTQAQAVPPQFVAIEPMVPYSQNDKLQTLAGFMIAGCDPSSYGELTMYTTPSNTAGPALVDSEINANTTISGKITVLDQKGSTVTTGAMQILPVSGALVYLVPLYVSSSTNPFPQLKYVVAVLGNSVAMGSSSSASGARADALQAVLNSAVPVGGVGPLGQPTAPTAAEVRTALEQALRLESAAKAALASGNLGLYQSYEDEINTFVTTALNELSHVKTQPGQSGSGTGAGGGSSSGGGSPSGAGSGSGSKGSKGGSTTTTTTPATSTTSGSAAPGGTTGTTGSNPGTGSTGAAANSAMSAGRPSGLRSHGVALYPHLSRAG
jgi:uncharacterized membrane protein (UPF0182 family)